MYIAGLARRLWTERLGSDPPRLDQHKESVQRQKRWFALLPRK
jgi:hypothetical protein